MAFCAFFHPILRFYPGFLDFTTWQILIQPFQYWVLFWLEDLTALLCSEPTPMNHSQFCMLTNIKSLFSIGCCNMQNKMKVQPLKYFNFVFFPQQKQINTPDLMLWRQSTSIWHEEKTGHTQTQSRESRSTPYSSHCPWFSLCRNTSVQNVWVPQDEPLWLKWWYLETPGL